MNSSIQKYSGYTYALMRLFAGLLFACHGGQKLLGFPPGGHGSPTDAMGWIAGAIELIGGFMIAFGFLTRVAAFIACGEMAVAYFMVHFPGGPFPIVNRGEPAVLYCFVFLYILTRGGGPLSIDALIWRAAPAEEKA